MDTGDADTVAHSRDISPKSRNLGYPVGEDCVNSNIENEIKFERGNETRIGVVSIHKIQFWF